MTRIVLLVLLAAAILGTWQLLRSRAQAASAANAAAARAAADRVVPVLTAAVAQEDVPIWLEGLGSVAAFYTVTVKTQVDGRIDKVMFREGQRVKAGDVLVQIDPRPFQIALESAQASLARDQATAKNGQLNLERYKTLSDQNLIAKQQYTDQQSSVDQLQAQTRADQAAVGSARLNLEYARVTSPIDGIAGLRLVDPGNVVHATDATGLVVVTQLDPIAVLFTLPEDDLVEIQGAMADGPLTVEARSRDGGKLLGTGKLAVIDNQINQATATIRLKAVFDNPDQRLWPNEFVKARIKLTTIRGALVMPSAVVQHGPQGTFAYAVGSDATAVMKPITVQTTQGDVAIVTKGLAPGDTVIVEGQAQIRPGAKVSPKPADAPGATPGAAGGARSMSDAADANGSAGPSGSSASSSPSSTAAARPRSTP